MCSISLEPRAYPIVEHDPDHRAIIEPTEVVKPIDIPKHCVLCFFGDQIQALAQEYDLRILARLRSEIGDHLVYALPCGDREVALLQPGVGAPLSAGLLEEAIALGCTRFVACGGAGVLDRDVAPEHLLIPERAIRDEGTSYHYLPPSRAVSAHPEAVEAIAATLDNHKLAYRRTTTWTTDAIYRETQARIAARRAEGCLTVEMEAAALFAVAQFRGVILGQILYAGDDVSGDTWDAREWNKRHTTRRDMIPLAAEACLRL